MAVLPIKKSMGIYSGALKNLSFMVREEKQRKQVVGIILLVIALLQLIDLPGAIMTHSVIAIGSVVLGLMLCGIAMIFQRLGKPMIVGMLLILAIDLGCGLTLLMSSTGLDISDLPVFDVLIVSELIAVCLLPAVSVFPVALTNIVFTLADLAFQPCTPSMRMLLGSEMGYSAIVLPISLQIIVAVVSYVWVRTALTAIARADRAEEIVEMRKREARQRRQLDLGIEHLLQVLVRAAHGERNVHISLNQDNILWRVGNALNPLLTRLRRYGQAEMENRYLREEIARMAEALHEAKVAAQQVVRTTPPPHVTARTTAVSHSAVNAGSWDDDYQK